jgi:hypothetical protein
MDLAQTQKARCVHSYLFDLIEVYLFDLISMLIIGGLSIGLTAEMTSNEA